MTCEEQRHRLVTELQVAHAGAVALGVVREEEHGEEVALVRAGCAALADHAVDRRVETLPSSFVAARHRNGQVHQQRRQWQHRVVECGDRGSERFANLVRLTFDVGVEERLADHRQRVRRHLVVHLQHVAVLPMLRAPLGVCRHDVTIRGDAGAMKGRLRQAALAEVELVLARQEPIAQQHLRALESASLVEVARVGDEDVADLVGVRREDDGLSPDAEHRDVAVRLLERRKKRERTPRDADHGLAGIAVLPARWKLRRKHSLATVENGPMSAARACLQPR